jgi:hypothetical protein
LDRGRRRQRSSGRAGGGRHLLFLRCPRARHDPDLSVRDGSHRSQFIWNRDRECAGGASRPQYVHQRRQQCRRCL